MHLLQLRLWLLQSNPHIKPLIVDSAPTVGNERGFRFMLATHNCVAVCCSVLQRVAACHALREDFASCLPHATALQCVAVCCSVSHNARIFATHNSVAECCKVLQSVAECCRVSLGVVLCHAMREDLASCLPHARISQNVAERCRASHRVAVCHTLCEDLPHTTVPVEINKSRIYSDFPKEIYSVNALLRKYCTVGRLL